VRSSLTLAKQASDELVGPHPTSRRPLKKEEEEEEIKKKEK